jgi:tryptophan halogenase
MVGQGLTPRAYHPFADLRPEAEVAAYLDNVAQVISKCVTAMPDHADFIAAHCAASAAVPAPTNPLLRTNLLLEKTI